MPRVLTSVRLLREPNPDVKTVPLSRTIASSLSSVAVDTAIAVSSIYARPDTLAASPCFYPFFRAVVLFLADFSSPTRHVHEHR